MGGEIWGKFLVVIFVFGVFLDILDVLLVVLGFGALKQGAGILAEVDQSPPEPILVGVGVMHFVEQLGSSNLVNLHFEVDRAFKTLPGRVLAAIWLLVSTLVGSRAFLYLAEARVDKRPRSLAKWVLGQDMTVAEFLAADIDNNGFVRYTFSLSL
ncbi:hypothetical protein Droror1_Dr00020388 [Drosera rotundifolia]